MVKSAQARKCHILAVLALLSGLAARSQINLTAVKSGDTTHPQYRMLESRLRLYEAFAEHEAWDRISVKKDSLKQNTRPAFAAAIRRRLEAEGYLSKKIFGRKDTIDDHLRRAIISFQADHGIDTTGFPGPVTLAAMNVSAARRAEQIRINMQRWQAMRDLPSEYILVNIPDFRMILVQDKRIVMQMKVVVGKKDRQTPVFNAKMSYLVLNPSWNIPVNVLRKDVIHKIKDDPAYLTKSHMDLFEHDSAGKHVMVDPASVNWSGLNEKNFPYEIVQQPGEDNALGKIKFMFPNHHSVYMHDSPAKKLFLSNEPMFSSGCVRLSDALKLGFFLLEREGWDQEKFNEALAQPKTQTVVLKQQPMVYLQYFTCWVDEQGRLQFRKDIYEKDR